MDNSTSEIHSSRPSRKKKPRNFEDFHVFDLHLQGSFSAVGHQRLNESNTDTKGEVSDDCRQNTATNYVSEKGDTVQQTNSQLKPPAKRGRPRKLVTDSGKQRNENYGNLVKGLPFCNSEGADPRGEADRLAQTSNTIVTVSDNELGTIPDHRDAGSARKRGRPKKCHKNNNNLTPSSGMGKGSTDDKSQSVVESKTGSGQKRGRPRKISIETGRHADDTNDENNRLQKNNSVNKSKVKSITDSAGESANELKNRGRKRKISDAPERCLKNSGERSISKHQRMETSISVDQFGRGKSRHEVIVSDIVVKTGETCSVDPISHVIETDRKEPVSENETGSETCQEADTKLVPVCTPKRKGRPPKIAPRTSRPIKARDSPKVPQLPVSSKSNAGSAIICGLCGHSLQTMSALKAHMMAKHSLVWDKDHPEGINSPSLVIKRLGYIDCQRCKKRFKFPQYYKHHTIWCGREDETATCEICNSTMRAMWLQQHLTAHRTKEKQQALEEEKRKAMEEQKKKKEEEDDEEIKDDTNSGDSSGIKKSKRQAAKSALKLMSDLTDSKAEEVEAMSTEDDYKQVHESSEEDTNDEGEEEEDPETNNDTSDDSEDGDRERKKKMSGYLKAPSSENICEPEWYCVCEEGADVTAGERLKKLHTFYTSRSDGRLFAEMYPQPRDWVPLESRETQEFYPNKSVLFSCGQTRKTSKVGIEETSLGWGQTTKCNGKVYCYTGGPIWAIEWCPLPESVDHSQVVAIAADLTTEELPDTHITMTGPGLVQIWSMAQLKNTNSSQAQPSLEYSIAHNSGYVRGLSWCPVRCFDKEGAGAESLHRLGLLAVACSDGSVLIYSLPKPSALNSQKPSESGQAASKIYQPQPTLTLISNTKGCGPCLCVSWQQGGEFKYIIGGYGCGAVFLWDLTSTSPLLRVDQSHLRPLRTFLAHRAAVVSCTWNPRSPSVFATSSFDHKACMWDAERPLYPNSSMSTHASFPVHHSLCWAGPMHPGFFSASERLYITDRSQVMFHGLAKMARKLSGMSIMVQHHTACVWDVSFCPFYEVLVSCDAIGKVKVSLPPMAYLRCRTRYKASSWVDSKVLHTDLYQAQIKTRHMSTSSSAQPSSSASNISQNEHNHHNKESISHEQPSHSQAGPPPSIASHSRETDLSSSVTQSSQKAQKDNVQTSTSASTSKSDTNTEGQTVAAEDRREENIFTDSRISSNSASENVTNQTDTKPSYEETLHFQESELTKLKVFKNLPQTKCELEDFGGSNTNAIHKVRLNPNPFCCLWLASGGQAGLLRLDNLTDLVQPHARDIRQFYNKYKKRHS